VLLASGLLAAGRRRRPDLYALGNWPAPFGIVLVLDRLSALMLLLTAVLALGLLFACAGDDSAAATSTPSSSSS
jgi:multicomponent K+:H+ antiporter subunit D